MVGAKQERTAVPSDGDIGATRRAQTNESAAGRTDEDGRAVATEKKSRGRKPQTRGERCTSSRRDAQNCVAMHTEKSEVRPEGFEPPTLGSEDKSTILATIYGSTR